MQVYLLKEEFIRDFMRGGGQGMKKMALIAAMVMVLGMGTLAQAMTFELRDFFELLPLSEQSPSNLWTFQNQDHNGPMLPHDAAHINHYDAQATQWIGGLIPSGGGSGLWRLWWC
jgi:hypothetical protein